jgi:hypothetical protein
VLGHRKEPSAVGEYAVGCSLIASTGRMLVWDAQTTDYLAYFQYFHKHVSNINNVDMLGWGQCTTNCTPLIYTANEVAMTVLTPIQSIWADAPLGLTAM